MKSNIFIFHGTEGHPEENWFPWLKSEMESKGCSVFVPQFPSPPKVPAQIKQWFEVLEGYKQYLNQGSVFIGHSLGGVFALRVLEKLGQPVRAAILVGTPIGERPLLNYDRDVAFSGFEFNWQKIKKNAKNFRVYHSDNDPYVGLENGKKLAENLSVELSFVSGAGHFNIKTGYTKFESLRDELLYILS